MILVGKARNVVVGLRHEAGPAQPSLMRRSEGRQRMGFHQMMDQRGGEHRLARPRETGDAEPQGRLDQEIARCLGEGLDRGARARGKADHEARVSFGRRGRMGGECRGEVARASTNARTGRVIGPPRRDRLDQDRPGRRRAVRWRPRPDPAPPPARRVPPLTWRASPERDGRGPTIGIEQRQIVLDLEADAGGDPGGVIADADLVVPAERCRCRQILQP